jgi:tRNA G18 (ribose-2'-O)-methylase SpoU
MDVEDAHGAEGSDDARPGAASRAAWATVTALLDGDLARRGLAPRTRRAYEADLADLAAWAAERDLPIVAVDNLPGAVPLETLELPRRCVLVFGQEGSGISDEVRAVASVTTSIAQFGSTRSINAGVAAGIAMHAWIRQHG